MFLSLKQKAVLIGAFWAFFSAVPAFAQEPPVQLLSATDVERYQQIFALQEAGQIKKADKYIADIDNEILMGHVLSQRYLHPTAWRSTYSELKNWLDIYNDHPAASRIKWLADKRKPRKAAAPKKPKKGYLNGVGNPTNQSWRPYIPTTRTGRASPRQTAKIASTIRRSIRRKEPTNASKYLNQKSVLRYLTAEEEAHLRGEIAHGYFIFGLDDKALRTARQAIAKGKNKAYMAYWAAGLAAYRSHQPDLAGIYFRTLAEEETAPAALRSSAAFWAHRIALARGEVAQAMTYLDIAASYPDLFYGVMARQASGQDQALEFTLPPLSDDFNDWLIAQRGGRRTLALLQVGNWTEAGRELRYLYAEASLDRRRDMMVFAVQQNMPGLAFRIADIFLRNHGERYNAALYPRPEVAVEFQVDQALVWAIARRESSFYPLARSRVKASGLMQIMPATAAFISGDRRLRTTHRHLLHNPAFNLKLGQDYIRHLLDERVVNGELVRMLAAYNGGPGNLNKWLRGMSRRDDLFLMIESIPARETRNYVKSVVSDMAVYRQKFGQDTPILRGLVTGLADQEVGLLLTQNSHFIPNKKPSNKNP